MVPAQHYSKSRAALIIDVTRELDRVVLTTVLPNMPAPGIQGGGRVDAMRSIASWTARRSDPLDIRSSAVNPVADLWGKLPRELIERILDLLVDGFDQDPAYQWTTLRHVAKRQMRCIERHFWRYWIPKLTITLYSGPRCQIDYRLSDGAGEDGLDNRQVRFQTLGADLSNSLNKEDIRTLWSQYSFENRIAHLRLGEGVLNNGMTGGYIVNDTDIADLEVEEDGLGIAFDWRRTLDALLREEVMMRRLQAEMALGKKAELAAERRWPPSPRIQRLTLVKHFVLDTQIAKRVAVQKHRLMRYDPSGRAKLGSLTYESQHLHKQRLPALAPPENPRRGCCAICSRRTGPSIFEVVSCEESVVLSLDGWERLGKDELLDLYAEAYSWNCYRCLGQENDIEWQQTSKKDWLSVCGDGVEKLHTVRRWNPWF